MSSPEIRLWPGVPNLYALGARTFEDLMGLSGELEGEQQAEFVGRRGPQVVLRYALPGTMHQAGTRPSEPRGAGTGFVNLQRWTAGTWSERLGARFKTPRSASFAAHAWNLLCHLRQAGVGTAEPLAMGQGSAALFARQSFLVTRALDPMQTLPEYLAEHTDDLGRRHVARALGLFLGRILEAGVELPSLAPDQIYVSRRKREPSCAMAKIAKQVNSADPDSPVPDLMTSRLPELALACVDGGRIHPRLGWAARLAQLQHWNAAQRDLFCARDLLRVAHHALGQQNSNHDRRRALRRLQAHD